MNIPQFALLNGEITNTTMRKLNYELELLRRIDYPRSRLCKTCKTMGYPWRHELQRYRATGESVPLWKVDRLWQFEPQPAEDHQLLLTPVVQAPELHQQRCQAELAAIKR
jgi:hypothetical protein